MEAHSAKGEPYNSIVNVSANSVKKLHSKDIFMFADMEINFSRTQQHQNSVHIQLRNPWSRNEFGIDGSATCNGKSGQNEFVGISIEIEANGGGCRPGGRELA